MIPITLTETSLTLGQYKSISSLFYYKQHQDLLYIVFLPLLLTLYTRLSWKTWMLHLEVLDLSFPTERCRHAFRSVYGSSLCRCSLRLAMGAEGY